MDSQSPEFETSKKTSQTRKFSRRNFIRSALGLGGVVGAGYALKNIEGVAAFLEQFTQSEESCLVRWEHAIDDQIYEFIPFRAAANEPFEKDGANFDLSSFQYVSPEDSTKNPHSLLLSAGDIYQLESGQTWRDAEIDPGLLIESKPFKDMMDLVDKNMSRWQNVSSKMQTEQDSENINYAIDMDSPVMKAKRIAYGVHEAFKYDEALSDLSILYANTPFHKRLEGGQTNCQEYTLVTAVALARMGLSSDIIYFGYEHEVENEDDTSETKTAYHVANVIDIDGACVVVDSTYGRVSTLHDYIRSHTSKGKNIFPTIRYTSFIAGDNRELLPWHEQSWVANDDVNLGVTAYYKQVQ